MNRRRGKNMQGIAKILTLGILFFGLTLIVGTIAAQTGGGKTSLSAIMQQQTAQHENATATTAVSISGKTVCSGGNAAGYACDNVDLMSVLTIADMGGGSVTSDIWGWTSSASGKEYALVGINDSTAFVDVTDAENPIYVGRLPKQTSNSIWRDIKVYQDHAYIVSEANNHGMQIFDLTQLDAVVAPPIIFSNTAWYNGPSNNKVGATHNVVINEDSGYAYVVGSGSCSGGLHMIDLSTPASPTFAGCFSNDGYTHDAQCVNYNGPDPDYTGQEICFNSNEDTLTIVDVTDKNSPVQVSRTGYAGASYAHQAWVTEDHKYLLLSDESDESSAGHNTRTYIWDVTNLDAPVNTSKYTGPNASIDHNLYIKGNYVFQSNYTSGLQILEIGGGSKAFGITGMYGYFDTYTPNNGSSFWGSWSNYPYFGSGNIIVASQQEGLFVVRPQFAPTAVDMQTSNAIEAADSNTTWLFASLLFVTVSAFAIAKRRSNKQYI